MLNFADYTLAQFYFQKGMALVYFFAFLSLALEAKVLWGEKGILPMQALLDRYLSLGKQRYYSLPSLFWFCKGTDRNLHLLSGAGVLVSLLMFFGLIPAFLALTLLWALYLSFVTLGQTFLSYQWDILLLEVTVIAVFFSLQTPPSPFMLIAMWFLYLRFMITAGAAKLVSADPTWRKMRALDFHFETQPIPNALAWFAHQSPRWLKTASCYATLVIEIFVPLLIIAPDPIRFGAFVLLALLQIVIILTGNFTYFNLLTLVLSLPILSIEYIPVSLHVTQEPLFQSASLSYIIAFVALFFIYINLLQFVAFFRRYKWMPQSLIKLSSLLSFLRPFGITGGYGLFAVMTTTRYEINIEGSDDGHEWKEYVFKRKPSDLKKRPGQIAPLQARVDWQMWFAALNIRQIPPFLQRILTLLMEGDEGIMVLFRQHPFPDKPPETLRLQIYKYHFTDWKTKRETGQWWSREFVQAFNVTKNKPNEQ